MNDTSRITGPLRTWYDLHEALAHEASAIAAAAEELTPDELPRLDARFGMLRRELRTHSEVEDAMLFPEIERRGGTVAASFGDEHHHELQHTCEQEPALPATENEPPSPGDRRDDGEARRAHSVSAASASRIASATALHRLFGYMIAESEAGKAEKGK